MEGSGGTWLEKGALLLCWAAASWAKRVGVRTSGEALPCHVPEMWSFSNLQPGSNLLAAHLTWKLALPRLPLCFLPSSALFPFTGPCATSLYHRGLSSSQLLFSLKALHALPAAQVSTCYQLLVVCSPPALQQNCFLIAQHLQNSSSIGHPVKFWASQG